MKYLILNTWLPLMMGNWKQNASTIRCYDFPGHKWVQQRWVEPPASLMPCYGDSLHASSWDDLRPPSIIEQVLMFESGTIRFLLGSQTKKTFDTSWATPISNKASIPFL